MKLVSFHLMPYRPLDLAEAAKHRSPAGWRVRPLQRLSGGGAGSGGAKRLV
jgi:hypothetical protein